jgi:hypothetical protein
LSAPGTPSVMIPPGEAAGLLARWAAPALDSGKAQAAVEKIRGLCDAAAKTGTEVALGLILDVLGSLEEPVISGAEPGTRLPVAWALEDAIALTGEPGTECAWTPHPTIPPTACSSSPGDRAGRCSSMSPPRLTPGAGPTGRQAQ